MFAQAEHGASVYAPCSVRLCLSLSAALRRVDDVLTGGVAVELGHVDERVLNEMG